MNLAILVSSLKYLQEYKLIVSSSLMLYQELKIIKYSNKILINSLNRGDNEIVKEIININEDQTILYYWLNPLHYYINDTEKIVIDNIRDIDAENQLILNIAFNNCSISSIQYIIDAGADIHKCKEEILYDCIRGCCYKEINFLMKYNPDLDKVKELVYGPSQIYMLTIIEQLETKEYYNNDGN